MSNKVKYFLLSPLLILLMGACLQSCKPKFGERNNVLIPQGEPEIIVMDFSSPIRLDPTEPGWYHYKFLTRNPMQISFEIKENVPAIKLSTNNSASMLFRYVEIDLQQYSFLSWQWYIEQPIESDVDEKTEAGDDHPARLFIGFKSSSGEDRYMEVIWGNKLKAGQYKYIGSFPHYVARGGNENIKKWFHEEINLLEIYRKIWSDAKPVKVTNIALFCDSDETDTRSVSYFADVRMRQAPSNR